MNRLLSLINCLIGLLFPNKCIICKNIYDGIICDDCHAGIKYLRANEGLIYFVAEYSGIMKKAIKLFKFKKKLRLCEPLANIIIKNMPYLDADCIIPVPLYQQRLRSRGFNQSELIAKSISAELAIPLFLNTLIRFRETKPQFSLNKNERKENIKNAFLIINKEDISGKKVLLVDDIYTTGSTVRECKRVLLQGGAKSVFAIVLSKAVM